MSFDQAQRRAEALFRKEQQAREAQQATADYHAKQHAMQEKTARLRALRLARDAGKQSARGSTVEPTTSRRAPRARASH